MHTLGIFYRVTIDAYYKFLADDGWAIASHIALSALMALFPFLILVTALAGFLFGSTQLADEVANIVLQMWPTEVASPIASEIRRVLLGARSDLLTIGVALAIYFASSGIESLRIGLNRAYGASESRSWWILRLESIGYVLIAAIALLVLSFLVVLAPLIFASATPMVSRSPRAPSSTRRISLAMGDATSVGHICRTMFATSSASCVEPNRKPASAVTRMRKGNSAISADKAMWLAIAQPSSARNL